MTLKHDMLMKAGQYRQRDEPFVVATVVRSEAPTSAKPGDKAIVDGSGEIDGWIGGGCAQPAVIKSAQQALRDGRPRLIRVTPTGAEDVTEQGITTFGMSCHSGGTLDIFLEPYLRRRELLVVGDSPTARALCLLADNTGFTVTAVAPRAQPETFPGAAAVRDSWELEAPGAVNTDWVVVATQGKHDERGLLYALGTGAGKIAFVSSARKADKLRASLKERGEPADRVDAIVAPAGLDIGARTPEEIALSILAAMVRDIRQGQPVGRRAAIETEDATDASGMDDATAEAAPCCGGGTRVSR